MIASVIYVSLALLGLALLAGFVRVAVGPTLADRVAAADLLAFVVVGLLGLTSALGGETALLDVALVLALIAFLATVAFARYLDEEEEP